MPLLENVKAKAKEGLNIVVNTLFPESPAAEAGKEAWEAAKAFGRTVKSSFQFAWSFGKTVFAAAKSATNYGIAAYNYSKVDSDDEDESMAAELAGEVYEDQGAQDLQWAKQEAKDTIYNAGSTLYNMGATAVHVGETAYYGVVNPALYATAYGVTGVVKGVYGFAEAVIGDAVSGDLVQVVEDREVAAPQLEHAAAPAQIEAKPVQFLPGYSKAQTAAERLVGKFDDEEVEMVELPEVGKIVFAASAK